MTNQTISIETKKLIADDLINFVESAGSGSQSKAARMLENISHGTISNIRNGKWDAISDKMWLTIQKQVSTSYSGEWKIVEDTTNYQKLTRLFDDARMYANTFGVIGNPGFGKSCTAKDDCKLPNSFVIECNEYFTKRTFLRKLLSQMGVEPGGYQIHAMLDAVITNIRRMDHPIIKIDEADKLSDPVLLFFISLYNALEGKCGFVLTGAPYLQNRIESGADRNKRGYKEILSRLGSKFITLLPPTADDIKKIVRANGVYDEMEITKIINESNGDLRRVERMVHAYKRKQQNRRAA